MAVTLETSHPPMFGFTKRTPRNIWHMSVTLDRSGTSEAFTATYSAPSKAESILFH